MAHSRGFHPVLSQYCVNCCSGYAVFVCSILDNAINGASSLLLQIVFDDTLLSDFANLYLLRRAFSLRVALLFYLRNGIRSDKLVPDLLKNSHQHSLSMN